MTRENALDCRAARTGLSARYDGEHSDAGASLTRHIASCPDCAEFERGLAALGLRFQVLRTAEPGPALGARIAAAPGARASRRNAWLLRAAAALAGFAGVHLLAQARTTPREPGALELLSATGRSQARPPTHTPPELALLLRLADRSETR